MKITNKLVSGIISANIIGKANINETNPLIHLIEKEVLFQFIILYSKLGNLLSIFFFYK